MSKRDATVAIEGKVPKQPQRRTQRERSETTKKRILQAAATVLREHGYAGFRTEVVAQEAGLSRGAMLHHFPRKNDLLIATNKELYKRALEESLRVMKKNAKNATTVGVAGAIRKTSCSKHDTHFLPW